MSTLRIRPRRLLLVGSVLVDILMYVDRLPERGGDCIARRALLTSGVPPAAALRTAQRSMRAEGRWRSPVYWAAFAEYGLPARIEG